MTESDITVEELVQKIKRGDIRLPELQRQYMWDKTRVRDLLDSLYRGYPSGSILTWETDEDVATRNFAIGQETVDTNNHELLLDGQQRLTSLAAVLRGEGVTVKGRKNPIDILFNLDHPDESGDISDSSIDDANDDDEDVNFDEYGDDVSDDEITDEIAQMIKRMAFVVASPKLANWKCMVSVSKIFRERDMVSILREDAQTPPDDTNFGKYYNRLTKLQSIKDYKFRVVKLPRELSYEKVTDVFVRVNSRGLHLKASDLALAQITSKWRGSSQEFYKFDNDCRENFGFDLGLPIHLKNLVSYATQQSRFKTVGNLPQEKLMNEWNEAKKGMEFALSYLYGTVRIDNTALLSSPFIIVALAALRKQQAEPDEKIGSQLRRWVLTANAKGRYSRGSTETLLDQDLTTIYGNKGIDQLLQNIERQVGRLEIVADDLTGKSQRSALFKTMFLAFRAVEASDWDSPGLVISLKSTGVKHRIQGHHIFPRSILEKAKANPTSINEICNIAFVSGDKNRKTGTKLPQDYLPSISAEELMKQCIPVDEALWKIEKFEDFLEERRQLVAKRLNEYINIG